MSNASPSDMDSGRSSPAPRRASAPRSRASWRRAGSTSCCSRGARELLEALAAELRAAHRVEVRAGRRRSRRARSAARRCAPPPRASTWGSSSTTPPPRSSAPSSSSRSKTSCASSTSTAAGRSSSPTSSGAPWPRAGAAASSSWRRWRRRRHRRSSPPTPRPRRSTWCSPRACGTSSRAHGVDVLACRAGATRTPNYEASAPQGQGAAHGAGAGGAARARCARQRPSVVPGFVNELGDVFMTRLLSRRAAIRFMGKTTRRLYTR